MVIFYEKIFSWFFVWVNFGDFQTIFGIQAGRTNVPVRYDRPSGGDKVEFVEAEGRRKVEGLRKIPRRRKEKYFLGCSMVWNSVPGLY